MKINRRDYLKRMGAAGVFAGAAGLDVLAHDANPQQTCPANPTCPDQTAPLIWNPPWCNPLPANDKVVKLIFEGLTGIAPRSLVENEERCGRRMESGKVVCEVGFHSKRDSGIDHELEISAYSNVVDPSTPPKPKEFKDREIEKIEICVDDPELDQAYFYQRGEVCTRRDLAYDEDFRWIIDFESDYLYRKHLSGSYLRKYTGCYSPVLTVRHGIFYTLLKTGSTFLARSEDNENFIDMGPVARIMAANVYVKSGSLKLKVDDDDPYIVQPPGEIYFKNHCMKGANYCFFKPKDKDKKKRSDFFLNYKAFDRKGHSEYQLHLLRSGTPMIPNVICERKRFEDMRDRDKEKFFISDESPCSAAGYGGEYKGLNGTSGT